MGYTVTQGGATLRVACLGLIYYDPFGVFIRNSNIIK
jgi:hypothetical protein